MAERSFAREVEMLRVPAGTEFRGEGILAVTKALMEAGVAYVSGCQGSRRRQPSPRPVLRVPARTRPVTLAHPRRRPPSGRREHLARRRDRRRFGLHAGLRSDGALTAGGRGVGSRSAGRRHSDDVVRNVGAASARRVARISFGATRALRRLTLRRLH
jgi:hypothetical protein